MVVVGDAGMGDVGMLRVGFVREEVDRDVRIMRGMLGRRGVIVGLFGEG